MEAPQKKILTREDLYELVWSTSSRADSAARTIWFFGTMSLKNEGDSAGCL